MNEQKIHYEPHPVSPARKAELRAQGLTIVDAVYAPKAAPSGAPVESVVVSTDTYTVVAETREVAEQMVQDIVGRQSKARSRNA